ncbi:MAG: peptide deformylase [Planctomycetota bacterium]
MEPSVVFYPDPRLREAARPVDGVTQEIRDLVPGMFEAMEKARGIGLAGPQVGLGLRIIVASLVRAEGEEPQKEVYLNPRIVAHSGKVREEEGCLSLPGLYTPIDRFEEVTVEYGTLEGGTGRVTVSGLHARVFQHEIDHLDGVLILDKMSPAEKKKWAQLLGELEEQFASDEKPDQEARRGAAL